jgi:hypothetical protein
MGNLVVSRRRRNVVFEPGWKERGQEGVHANFSSTAASVVAGTRILNILLRAISIFGSEEERRLYRRRGADQVVPGPAHERRGREECPHVQVDEDAFEQL